jgi:hypothetical protein
MLLQASLEAKVSQLEARNYQLEAHSAAASLEAGWHRGHSTQSQSAPKAKKSDKENSVGEPLNQGGWVSLRANSSQVAH